MVNYKFNPKDCPIGIENRTKIDGMKEDVGRIEKKIDGIDGRITELFNHQSNRSPPWVTVIVTVLSSLVVGLGVYFLTRGGN